VREWLGLVDSAAKSKLTSPYRFITTGSGRFTYCYVHTKRASSESSSPVTLYSIFTAWQSSALEFVPNGKIGRMLPRAETIRLLTHT